MLNHSTSLIFWLIIALLIIAALSAYALILWKRVWHNQATTKQVTEARLQSIKNDLVIIAKSYQAHQLPTIEGAIRLKVLLDNFDPLYSQQPEFHVLHQIYEATQHIPTHDAWKALPKTEKKQYEQLFHQLESTHLTALSHAVETLLKSLTRPS